MIFETDLFEGRFLKRYKRFFADIELPNGEIITAHTANTGSMKSCLEPGWPVLVSFHDSPTRKLKYSLEMTYNGNSWIGVNTSLPNKLAYHSILKGLIPELSGYENIKAEKKIGDSRIDLFLFDGDLKNPRRPCYVEVKNVTYKIESEKAVFPDAVTTRGQKHLRELIALKKKGQRAVMLFVIQREDVTNFGPAALIDPEYAQLLQEAYHCGVEILPYQCKITTKEISVAKKIPLNF